MVYKGTLRNLSLLDMVKAGSSWGAYLLSDHQQVVEKTDSPQRCTAKWQETVVTGYNN